MFLFVLVDTELCCIDDCWAATIGETGRRKTVLGGESRQDVVKVANAIVLSWKLVCALPLAVHDELEQLSDQK